MEVITGIKQEISTVQQRRDQLTTELQEIDKKLETIYGRIPDVEITFKPPRQYRKKDTDPAAKTGRKRSGLKAELVVELMKEAGKPTLGLPS